MDENMVTGNEVGKSRATAGGVIFVGLGGTGREILQRMSDLISEGSGNVSFQNKPYKFLLVDTDERGAEDLKTPFKYVGGFIPEHVVKYHKEDISSWWWPEDTTRWLPSLPRVEDGAGQIRLLGRLGIYLDLSDIKNIISRYSDELKDFLTLLKSNTNANAAIKIDTFIVGSLAGGTGSSMFNDVAAVVQDVLKSKRVFQPQITGIFLTGDVYQNVINEEFLKERVQANTFASLAEYFYDKAASTARFRRRMINVSGTKTPISSNNFTNLILIQDVNKQGAIANLDNLYDFVASSLYTVALDYGRIASAQKNVSAVFTSKNLNLPDILSSMGAYSIYYPKEKIFNYANNYILSKMLPLYFYNNNNNRHEADEDNAHKEVDKVLNNLSLNYTGTKGKGANVSVLQSISDRLGKDSLLNKPLSFNDFFNRLKARKESAKQIYDNICKKADEAIQAYDNNLNSLFKQTVDDIGNKKITIVEEKINAIREEIQRIYTEKDFGYLDVFLANLKNKLEAIEDTLTKQKSYLDVVISPEKSRIKNVKQVLDKYNSQFLGSLRQMKYLEKSGISEIEQHYKTVIESYTYKHAIQLIQSIEKAVDEEINAFKDLESALYELDKSSVDKEVEGFAIRFDGTERITASRASILYADEIKKLVKMHYPKDSIVQKAYVNIAKEIYEEFLQRYSKIKNSLERKNLKQWAKSKIIEDTKKEFGSILSSLLNMDMFSALRSISENDDDVKQKLRDRISILSKVSPFINIDPAVRNRKAAIFSGYISLPSDNTGKKVDQRWNDISKELIDNLSTKLSGRLQKIASPNKQVITLSIVEGGISPESLTSWNEYITAYQRAIGNEAGEGNYKRDRNKIPVFADYQVEKSLEKLIDIMETGDVSVSKKDLDLVLNLVSKAYVLGNIVEKDDLRCYIKILHPLENDYWQKYIEEVTDGSGNKYYRFTPPGDNGKNLYKLYKYLSNTLSESSALVKELDIANQAKAKKLDHYEYKDMIKETIKKLDRQIKNNSSTFLGDLIDIYQKIRDHLDDLSYSFD